MSGFILAIGIIATQQIAIVADNGTPHVFPSYDACYERLNELTPLLVQLSEENGNIVADCLPAPTKVIGDLKENS